MHIAELFDLFFQPFDALSHQASLKDRDLSDSSLELTYGQIHVPSWKQILEMVQAQERKHFVDLGSGSGKAVLLTLYLYPHIQATGVELLPSLHNLAQEIVKKAQSELGPCQDRLTLLQKDLFEVDLKPYDLLLVNSTCYDDLLVTKMAQKLATASEGALVISLGRAIKAPHLEDYIKGAYRMGWQSEGSKTPVFVYRVKAV